MLQKYFLDVLYISLCCGRRRATSEASEANWVCCFVSRLFPSCRYAWFVKLLGLPIEKKLAVMNTLIDSKYDSREADLLCDRFRKER